MTHERAFEWSVENCANGKELESKRKRITKNRLVKVKCKIETKIELIMVDLSKHKQN